MFYLFLKITIGTAVRFFFRKIEVAGAENIPSDKPVIIVSNHPSAFLDPLVLGIFISRPLYFFARADIFSPGIGKWIMEKAHISPIYRIVDGIDSLEKNEAVFAHGYKLLEKNNALLLFGEGVTDEKFIRRVKPMKKGSMRIALGAEDKYEYKLGVQLVCAGINYSDPRKFRSDLLIRFSEPIDVGRFKELYCEHNNKAMLELNKEIYSKLKQQIIHVENPVNCTLLEQLLIITQKGLNYYNFPRNKSLKERWIFTKKLSELINTLPADQLQYLTNKSQQYFQLLKEGDFTEEIEFHDTENTRSGWLNFLRMLTGFPFYLAGMAFNYFPVKLSTALSRKVSKRPVFWSGTDLAFSLLTVPAYYALIYMLFSSYLNIITIVPVYKITLSASLFLLMPFLGIFAFEYHQRIIRLLKNKNPMLSEEDRRKANKLKKEITEELEQMMNKYSVFHPSVS